MMKLSDLNTIRNLAERRKSLDSVLKAVRESRSLSIRYTVDRELLPENAHDVALREAITTWLLAERDNATRNLTALGVAVDE